MIFPTATENEKAGLCGPSSRHEPKDGPHSGPYGMPPERITIFLLDEEYVAWQYIGRQYEHVDHEECCACLNALAPICFAAAST